MQLMIVDRCAILGILHWQYSIDDIDYKMSTNHSPYGSHDTKHGAKQIYFLLLVAKSQLLASDCLNNLFRLSIGFWSKIETYSDLNFEEAGHILGGTFFKKAGLSH
jgi:hypothetical protein